jgi:hypothetical protein
VAVIPIRVEPEEIHIRADRRLAFEVVTGFTSGNGAPEGAPRVLETDGDRLLVEFRTPVDLGFGIRWHFRTVEWLTLKEPEQIDFDLVPGKGPIRGGLKLLTDRFSLHDVDGCTEFRYESTFGIRWSVLGWLLGKLLIQRAMKQHMKKHLAALKVTIEARAERSRVYPLDCPHESDPRGHSA